MLITLSDLPAPEPASHPERGGRILALQHTRAQSQGGRTDKGYPHDCQQAVPYYQVWWADHGVVVMDDLTYKGCEFTDPLQTWPMERVLVVVERLAALHAGAWGMKPTTGGSAQTTDPQAGTRSSIAYYMETHTSGISTSLQTDISSAFHDLAYFVGGALSVEGRRAHENDIIDHYLKSLAEFGGPTMGRDDEVMAEYAHSFMSSFSRVVAPYSMQTKERVHAMTKRYMAAIDDHKTIQLLEALPEVLY
ncbi:hypothetical protein DL770_009234 [Monosporascus sp. CRB-9-2]|nr:hypothetical protein DL770_009234 [Monosporascus sp. CRB-9-2]